MEVIILAGGKGTRLQDVVKDRPKPLALIKETPFLSYLLDHLVSQGATHIVLSVGYKKEQIISFYGKNFKGVPISYAVEGEPLLTGGAIKNSEQFLKEDDSVFVVNGDTFCPLDFNLATEKFNEKKAEVLIPVKYLEDTKRYGTIQFDTNNRIMDFIEKREGTGYINVGCYLISRALLSTFKEKIFSFEKDFLEKKCYQHKFFAMPIDNFFIDIGVPADYFRACEIF